jgi:ligand-binding sensor domain-containing protein/signal transduction histidine kinase
MSIMRGMTSRLLPVILLTLTFLFPAVSSNKDEAGGIPQPAANYILHAWGTDEGLPQSSVSAIVQTRDGYLWLGTFGGIVRFDGIKFTVFDSANTRQLKSSRILSLYEDPDGALWIGTERGGLTRYFHGEFTTYTTQDGLPSDNIGGIYRDSRGLLWIGTELGVVSFRDGKFRTYTKADGLPANSAANFIEDAEGTLWVGTPNGLARWQDGRFTSLTIEDGLPSNDILALSLSGDGSLWLGTGNGLSHFSNGKFTNYLVQSNQFGAAATALYDDHKGTLWVVTSHGLYRMVNGEFATFSGAEELSGKKVLAINGDREGNVWIGTQANGLNRLKPAQLMAYGEKRGLKPENIVPITEDAQGNIWMGQTCGGVARLEGEKFTFYTRKEGLPNACVWSLLAEPDGTLWLGSWNDGLTMYKENKFVTFRHTDGLSSNVVLAIFRDSKGTLWIGTGNGLNKMTDGGFTAYHKADGLVSEDVRFITEDRAGALWVGTTGGLSRFEGGKFTNYTIENGLSNNFVRDIYEDPDGNLWIGTYGGGLNRFKNGDFVHYRSETGLFDDVVSRILEDDKGNLWMSGNRGIFRVRRSELNDFAEGRISSINSISYGVADGMKSRETNGGGQPAGWKARDGRLWFPTVKGAVVIDPSRSSINQLPPPVVIERILANKISIERPAKIELPPGGADLEIQYTGLSFIEPEKVRFKYKLEGYDTDWVEAGTRRTAYYTNIPPGNYQFRVIAANNDGIWNTEGAMLGVVAVPPFWKTWWFYALVILAVCLIIYYLYRLRLSRLERAHRAQKAFSQQLITSQENERRRIAAELHDSLGQNLLIIKNRALIGASKIANTEAALKQLDEISTTASSAIEEVRAIAHNLHPYQLERLGLTSALKSVVEKVADSSVIKFSAEIEAVDNLLSVEDEINIYRIVQESLNNIVRHSNATEAKVAVHWDGKQLYLNIQDNGKGFDPQAVNVGVRRRGGFGLQGIEERTRMLGGRCAIQSTPNGGTSIVINVTPRQHDEKRNGD